MKMNTKTMMRDIVSIVVTVLGVMGIGYLLLVLVCIIPNGWILDNVDNSAYTLVRQGNYPSGYVDGWFLDNYTDADCISITYNKNSENPFYNALNAFQYGGGNTKGLWSTVCGDTAEMGDHSYLWHGYRIWLKPLLMKYNITAIRTLCYGVIIFLMVILCIALVIKTNNMLAFIPFLISFTFFNFQMESISLLFFNDIFVALSGCMAVVYLEGKEKKKKYYKEIFAGIGAIVAFTSMLIMPVLTIGFPIVVWIVIEKRCPTWKEKALGVLKYSICWFVGYAATMLTKIVISSIIFKKNGGIGQVLAYTGSTKKYTIIGRIYCVYETFKNVVGKSEIQRDLLAISIILILIYGIIRNRKELKKLYDCIPYLIVALYPCIWVFICSGHAGHGWTYFNCSISMYAFFAISFSLCGFEKRIPDEEEK